MINADISLSVSSKLWIESSFKFPRIGKFIHSFNLIHWTKNIYSDSAIMFVGIRDLLKSNNLILDDNVVSVAKDLRGVQKIFTLVLKGVSGTDNKNLMEIGESVTIALNALEEIITIIEKKKYDNFKKDIFSISSQATLSNLNKYKEPIYYEN